MVEVEKRPYFIRELINVELSKHKDYRVSNEVASLLEPYSLLITGIPLRSVGRRPVIVPSWFPLRGIAELQKRGIGVLEFKLWCRKGP